MQAIVVDPSDPNTIWLGGPNGGVWVTHDGGATWTPLTDKQASLSIASLSLDPTDATNQTLIAGTGLTSNGTVGSYGPGANLNYFLGDGGQRIGILHSTDGGTTWSAPAGDAALAGQCVVGVAARGQVLLAATFEPWAFHSNYEPEQNVGGLYRSADGGETFALVAPASGLPAGPVTSLVEDPDNTNTLYAAVTNQGAHAETGVYVSNDIGQTWTEVFGAAQSNGLITAGGDQMIARVATATGGEIAVALVDVVTGKLAGLFLRPSAASAWTQLVTPNVNPGGQGLINLVVALDPTHPGVVYVTGDSIGVSPYTTSFYRVTTAGAVSETDANTSNNSTAHTNSRAIAFDSTGRLIFGSDGGIYARSNPTSSSGAWTGLNGANLSLGAPYAVAFDGNSDRMEVACQDTGVALENAPGSQAFTADFGGDGTTAGINDVTAGAESAIYGSSQFLSGLTRTIVDSQGNLYGPTPVLQVNLVGDEYYQPGYSSPFVLNKIDPSRIAVGCRQSLRDPGSLDR